jgi:glycosyltransferase involved in cell wall biosynthesis
MLFSIIVANYNNGKFLPKLIETVESQTYTNWELIIVDDCSTDNSVEILAPFLNNLKIKLIQHTQNKGAASAFKIAVDNSSGKLIGMLGADDGLVSNALQIMVSAFDKHKDASLINSNCYTCSEIDLSIIEKYQHYKPIPQGQQLINFLTVGSFAVFSRIAYDKTQGFDINFKRALDHDIYLKLDEVGKLYFIEDYLYLYRQNPIGISQGENGTKAAQFSLLAKKNAYNRRLNTSIYNISKKEYNQISITWCLREAYTFRNIDKKKCNKNLKEVVSKFPKVLFSKQFLSIFLRNNFLN